MSPSDNLERIIAVRVELTIYHRLTALADGESRKASDMIRILIREAIEARERTNGKKSKRKR